VNYIASTNEVDLNACHERLILHYVEDREYDAARSLLKYTGIDPYFQDGTIVRRCVFEHKNTIDALEFAEEIIDLEREDVMDFNFALLITAGGCARIDVIKMLYRAGIDLHYNEDELFKKAFNSAMKYRSFKVIEYLMSVSSEGPFVCELSSEADFVLKLQVCKNVSFQKEE